MMNKRAEVRWFLRDQLLIIEQWFHQHGLHFKNEHQEVDQYLEMDGNANLSIKMRDGNLELKLQTCHPETYRFNGYCEGLIEQWEKCSKALKTKNEREIFTDPLIPLSKERLLLYFCLENERVIKTNERATEGCQVELTRIMLHNETIASFAFEAFGNEKTLMETLKKVTSYVVGQIPDLRLLIEDSYSYPTLLWRYK